MEPEVKNYLDIIGQKKDGFESIAKHIIKQDNVGLASFYLKHLEQLRDPRHKKIIIAYMNYLAAYPSAIYIEFVQFGTFSGDVYSKEIVINSNAVNLLEKLKNVENNNNYFELKVEDLRLSIKNYVRSHGLKEVNSNSKKRRLSIETTTDMEMVNFLLKSLKDKLEKDNFGVLLSALGGEGKDTKFRLNVLNALLNSNVLYNTEGVISMFLRNYEVDPDEYQLVMVKLLIEGFKHVVEKDEFDEIDMVLLNPESVSEATFLYLHEKINKEFKFNLRFERIANTFGSLKYSDMSDKTEYGSKYLERVKMFIENGRVTLSDTDNIDQTIKDYVVSDDAKRELSTWFKKLKDVRDTLMTKMMSLKY